MKIAILFHSKSGKTATFSNYLGSELRAQGHEAQVFSLETVAEPRLTDKQVELKDLPDLSGFDLVVLGGPTWLGPSPVTASFLDQASGVAQKPLYPFVTHLFPPFMNGRRALKVLRQAAIARAGKVFEGRAIRIGFSPSSPKVKRAAAEMAAEIGTLKA